MTEPRKITVDEARPFWADKSQHVMGSHPETLPSGEHFHYWASGPICGVFHPAHWPGVWMAHHGCKPEGWGIALPYAIEGLRCFWDSVRPDAIIGWTAKQNRAAVVFARRCGFIEDGVLNLKSGDIIMQSWRK